MKELSEKELSNISGGTSKSNSFDIVEAVKSLYNISDDEMDTIVFECKGSTQAIFIRLTDMGVSYCDAKAVAMSLGKFK